ncbi:MAG: hypothetical protein EHM61_19860 [Acidobacteria bacterium]|nr:MAG: hypothetical protein EHM61_19860 [Acidobacteriota bacterium]
MCRVFVLPFILIVTLGADPLRGQRVTQEIVVSDHTGARLGRASIMIESPQGMALLRLTAEADGTFSVVGLP